MEKYRNSEQPLSEYTERILNLFKVLKQDFREYSDQKTKVYNLTGPQILLIDVLSQNPGINLQELSEKLKMAKSNVSVIVDRLVCKGVVIREIPEENRRIVRLSLLPAFREKYISMRYKSQYWADMFRAATEEELDIVINGLEKCHELIKRGKLKKTVMSGEKTDSESGEKE